MYIYNTVKYVKSSFRWIHVPFEASSEVSAFCKHEKLEQDIQHILSHSLCVAMFVGIDVVYRGYRSFN